MIGGCKPLMEVSKFVELMNNLLCTLCYLAGGRRSNMPLRETSQGGKI